MMTFAPTSQQMQAETAAHTGRDVVIVAGAGAGKTSTLVHLAEVFEQLGLLVAYICYNASTAQQARSRFPRNTTCGTAHSFATKASKGRDGNPFWHHRLRSSKNGRGFQNARTVARILGVTDPVFFGTDGGLAAEQLAALALRTVRAFCGTADPELAAAHVPQPRFLPDSCRAQLVDAVLPIAVTAWRDLRARHGLANDASADGCLNIEHDHYLKFWQLSGRPIMVRGRGGAERPADVVMLDECQDANPVMAAIFTSQGQPYRPTAAAPALPGRQLILVGDQHQAINGWNGAVNIMGDFPDAVHVELTKSFRFGPAVAEVANRWLTLLGADLRITGHDPVTSVVGPVDDPEAILCRTNAGAMRQVLLEHAAGRRVHLVGDGEEVKAIAQAALDLTTKGHTFHADLRDFTSWGHVVTYCEKGELGSEDLETAVALVEEFGAAAIIAAVDRLVTAAAAEVTICTAHKSKGLEWSAVKIGDDFHAPRADESGVEQPPDRDELMLSYVAVTRAKNRLDVGSLGWVDAWLSRGVVPSAPADTMAPRLWAGQDGPDPRGLEQVALAQARVDAASNPLGRAVALLQLSHAKATTSEYGDIERASDVRAIVAAYEDVPDAAAVLARVV